jgi:hypothetical protein
MRWLIRLGSETRDPLETQEALPHADLTTQIRAGGCRRIMAANNTPFAADLTRPAAARPAPPGTGLSGGRWFRTFVSLLFKKRRNIAAASGGLTICAALIMQGGWLIRSGQERARQMRWELEQTQQRSREAEEQAERKRQAGLAKQRAELLSALPNKVAQWRKQLADATRLSKKAPPGLADAVQLSKRTADQIYSAIALLNIAPAELAAVGNDARQLSSALDLRKTTKEAVNDIGEYMELATADLRAKNILSGDEWLAKALERLGELEMKGDAASPYVPISFNVAAKRAQVTKLRASLSNAAAEARRREEAEQIWQRQKDELAAQKVGSGAPSKSIYVPTDSTATYAVVARGGTATLPTLTTRRNGTSGTSYASRRFDCAAHTFTYLGEGDTLLDAERSAPAGGMSGLVEGSISDFWWHYACDR